ncbi:MAG: acyl carrier protein [Chitinivibrionia bacterium]|nr:acyl carrier protein [Chitinivibrionia bacterium]
MDLQDFLAKFADLFNEKDAASIKADTKFKELDEWSSLIALSVIAMIEDEYSIAVKGNDIRNSDTVENLFNAVKGYK